MSSLKSEYNLPSLIAAGLLVIIPFVKTDMLTLVDFELFPKQLTMGLFSVILVVFALKQKVDKPLLNWVTIGYAIFIVAHFVSMTSAFNQAEAWGTTSKNLVYGAVLFALISGIYSNTIKIDAVAKGAVIFGLIVGGKGLLDIIKAYSEADVMNSLYGLKVMYVHKNFLASALLMSIPLIIYESIQNNKFFGILSKVVLGILLLDIALLRTRSVWIALLAGIVVLVAIYFIFSKSKESQKKWIIYLSIATGAFILAIVAILNFTSISEGVFNKASLDKRFVYWGNTVEMIQDKPITGVGAGNWRINFPKYGLTDVDWATSSGQTTINRPHNDLLWVLSETGIIGFIGFLVFIKAAFLFALSTFRTSNNDKEKWIVLLSIMGMVFFILYGFFEFPLERPEHFFFFILYVSIATGIYLKHKTPFGFVLKNQIVFSFLLITSLFSTYVISQRLSGAKAAKKVLANYGKQNLSGLVRNGNKAINNYYNMDAFGNPIEYFIGMGNFGQQQIPKAQTHFEQALLDHPYHMLSLTQMGNTYKFQNNFDEAMKYYRKVLSFSKLNEAVLLNIAEIHVRRKEYDKALNPLSFVSAGSKNKKFAGLVAETLYHLTNDPNYTDQPVLMEAIGKPRDKNELFNRYINYRKNNVKLKPKVHIDPDKVPNF